MDEMEQTIIGRFIEKLSRYLIGIVYGNPAVARVVAR
jgi:hypothetical protein